MKKRQGKSRRIAKVTNYRDTSWRLPKLDMSILGKGEARKP